MKTLSEYIQSYAPEHAKRIECRDGFSMSVQANQYAYCSPREDGADWYKMEIGYPSDREEALMEWCESPDRPTDTVYGYVPVLVIIDVISKHGGCEYLEEPAK
jgi:hypothetical protein